MRPRAELALALVALLALGMGAALLGSRKRPAESTDPRRSTFVTSPDGAQALAEALTRLGVNVARSRRRLDSTAIAPRDGSASGMPRTLLAFLAPSEPLNGYEARQLAARVRHGGDLLLAGPTAGVAISCYGFYARRLPDSLAAGTIWATHVLLPLPDSAAADSAGIRRAANCAVTATHVDTLLATRDGRAVALRLNTASGADVTLVADGALFSNRALRETKAGEFALGLVAGRYPRVVFDEYHHGFGPSGSLAGAVWAWSFRSPWGWAAWQLLLAGTLALAASAIRFGPARRVIERRRRSALEHVRALANALAAARGHDVAIATQVRGLRRRLARGGAAGRGPVSAWLDQLAANVRTPRARAAVATLRSLTQGPQPANAVLRAADAVEDVWDELKP